MSRPISNPMRTPARKPIGKPMRQQGAFLIMYVFMLVLILGFAGFALDLGLVYYRKAQLQAAADTIALNAARALNGTTGGLTTAGYVAKKTAEGTAFRIDGTLVWNAAALQFSASPDTPVGAWQSAAEVDARTALYARVDLSALPAQIRMVEPVFMRLLGVTTSVDVAPVAVAGPTALRITPLAICALSTIATATREAGGLKELVTYGFREGVTYNLLKINPRIGATDGAYFLVDPLAAAGAGTSGSAGMDAGAAAYVGPFMCAGKIARTSTGNRLRVRQLASFDMAAHINSRLGVYTGNQCTRPGGPPDTNIKTYGGSNAWQAAAPTAASAATVQGDNLPMSTIADQPPAPGQVVNPGDYGILWAFAPARKQNGTVFAGTDWPTLYGPGVTTTWSSPAPYRRAGSDYYLAPTVDKFAPGRRERRLMRIPLLNCGAAMPTTEATVLAYGRFFLSAPASATEVPGEFAGVEVAEAALRTDVEVFR